VKAGEARAKSRREKAVMRDARDSCEEGERYVKLNAAAAAAAAILNPVGWYRYINYGTFFFDSSRSPEL